MSKVIDERITEALSCTPPSAGDNLDGFEIDVEYYLSALELLDDFSLVQTGDPRCSLLATGKIRDLQKSPEEVARVLEAVWLEKLRYSHWEAHDLKIDGDSITLTFVTTSGVASHDLCVTGKVVVSGWRGRGAAHTAI